MNTNTHVKQNSIKATHSVRRTDLVKNYESVVQSEKQPTLKEVKYELQDVMHKAIINQSCSIKHRCLSCQKAPITRFNKSTDGGEKVFEPVTLVQNDDSVSFGGVMHCKNANYCPVCMQGILTEKCEQINEIEKAWLSKDNRAVILVTYTLAHNASHDFKELVDVLSKQKRAMMQWRAFRDLKENIRYFSSINALEATISDVNGLHPHFHDAWYLETIPTVRQCLELQTLILEQWKKALNKKGFDCSALHGVNVSFALELDGKAILLNSSKQIPEHFLDEQITSTGVSGDYISKIAKELTFSFIKNTKRHENRSFIQVLFEQFVYYTKKNEEIIYKYVNAMTGRARLYINNKLSKMLKDYNQELEEQALQLGFDDESFNEEIQEKALQVTLYEFSFEEWKKLCFNRRRSELLKLIDLDLPRDVLQRRIYYFIAFLKDRLAPDEYKIMMMSRPKDSIWSWIDSEPGLYN
jgi:hypothetical protein